MGLQDNVQEIDGTNTFPISLWRGSCHADGNIVPSLCIAVLIGTTDRKALKERLVQLEELEEEWFWACFHQQVQKQRENA